MQFAKLIATLALLLSCARATTVARHASVHADAVLREPPARRAPPVLSAPVVGGTAASPLIRRRFAALSMHHESQNEFFECGASILTARHVLTAAHCLFHPTTGEAPTGISVSPGKASRADFQPVSASSFHYHRAYRSRKVDGVDVYTDDVAVITLNEDIADRDIAFMQMARSESDLPPLDKPVFGVGFGQVSQNGPTSNTLLSVRLQRQAFGTCAAAERAPFRPFLNGDVSICATAPGFPGQGGQDTCNGDSGGALYWVRDGRPLLVGITSWGGSGCARAGTVAWYTRMTRYATSVQRLVDAGDGPVDAVWKRFP